MRYIIIKSCNNPDAWYAKRIGETFEVDEEVKYSDSYSVCISKSKENSKYGIVISEDADIFTGYVRVIKCDKFPHAWYAKKIGRIFKISDIVSFPDVHTIRLSRYSDRNEYGSIEFEDAEFTYPTFIQKIKISLGFNPKI